MTQVISISYNSGVFLEYAAGDCIVVTDEDLGTNRFGNLSIKLDLLSLPSVWLLLLLCFETFFV